MPRKVPAILVSMLLLAVCAAQVEAGDEIVAKGEGIVVTKADVRQMRGTAPPFFTPTQKALLEATVRTVVFAKEAEAESLMCEPARGLTGFSRSLAMSRCYIRHLLDTARLLPGAVQSYYRVHWRQFVDGNGKELPLDQDLRKRIRARILAAKRPVIMEAEYRRLCRKFNVIIVEDRG